MFMTPAEPLIYSLGSTVSRFSGFFYQCYIIPLALAVIVLGLGEKGFCPVRTAVHAAVVCLPAAGLYFMAAPLCGDFKVIGTVSHFILIAVISLYAAFFCPMRGHVRVVMAAAIVANINWAQSISTQALMPMLPLPLSNVLQLALLAAALVVIYLFRPSPSEMVPRAYWLSMLFIAILSTACLHAVRVLNGRSIYNLGYFYNSTALSIVLAAFFIVNLLIYYLYYVLVKEHRRASDMAAMQARMAQDQEFYRRTDALCRELQSLRHELKNHFTVMENLLREKKYGELQAYFDDYAGKNARQLLDFHCPNPLINMVITRQINTARAAGIRLDVVAAVPEKLTIADDDLSSLLSNMIDNGVEGCLQAGGDLVRATLHTEKGCLFITVTNPAPDDVLAKNPRLLTTKGNPAAHGFGIPIIRRIAEKYDGIASFSMENGWFTADAMLYLEGE